MKRNFKWMLVAILTICGAINVYAQSGYTLTRISNPELGEGEIDGYIAGGDRANDYTSCMAECGDLIFIATSRNLGAGWVNTYSPKCDFWGIFESAIHGFYPHPRDNYDGANIIAYNKKDGSFKIVYSSESSVYFRSAVSDGKCVYFGAFSADPLVKPYILEIDKTGNAYLADGTPNKVFETDDCVALRGCLYDKHVIFAGADDRNLDAPSNVVKLAVFRKSSSGDWNRVADYKDFGLYAYDDVLKNWGDCPIWGLAEYNNYLYVTIPTSDGFVIFRGHMAGTGETGNKWGWYWEEVAGKDNGKNYPGLSAELEAAPNYIPNLSGSLQVFDGKLYAYNFDHSIFGEFSVAYNGLKAMTLQTDPATALDYLRFMYDLLDSPQKVWCLNNATGKFELQESFTQNMLGTMNGRMGVYDGQLYVATLDPGHIYLLLSQIASSDIINLTPSQIISKLISLFQTSSLLKKSPKKDTVLIDQLDLLQKLLAQFLVCDIIKSTNINDILSALDLTKLNDFIKTLTGSTDVQISGDYKSLIDLIVQLIQAKLGGTTIDIPTIDLPDLSDVLDYKTLLEDIVKLIQDRLSAGTGTLPDIPGITDLLNQLLEKLNGGSGTTPDYTDLTALIELILERLGGSTTITPDYSLLVDLIKALLGGSSTTTPDYSTLIDLIKALLGGSSTTTPDYSTLIDLINSLLNGGSGTTPDYTSLLEFIQNLLNSGNTGSISEFLRNLLLGGLMGNLLDDLNALINGFNGGAISDYVYLYNRLRAEKKGCDIMRTSDGVNFEFITRDGLGDKYNYGCPSFLASENGLYIGTSNSFFGGQLWLLTNDGTPGAWAADDADAIQTITGAATQSGYYTLDGRRMNGKPSQKGIYIIDGKKVSY